MQRLHNESGFVPILELVLVAAVAAILAIIGYRAWQSRQSVAHPQMTQSPTPTAAPQVPKLSEYTNSELQVAFSYPAEWGVAALVEGTFIAPQTGSYKQINFSKADKVSIELVTGAYSSPLDGCGLTNPVQNAQHDLNAAKASVIGWNPSNIKRYMTGQGFNGPTVYLVNAKAGSNGPGWTQISSSDKVLVYKDIDDPSRKVKAGADSVCSTITQAQADEANAFIHIYHLAVNFSTTKVKGINAQFDARSGDDSTQLGQLVTALNSIK